MLNSIRRVSLHGNSIRRAFLSPFCSASSVASSENPASETENPNNFTVQYLVGKFGFSPDNARSSCKYLKIKSPEKPDSVIHLLEDNGFTREQISSMVRRYPSIITCDPQKTLLPKIEYFRSSGISEANLANIFLSSPQLFRCSIEKQIAPKLDYLKHLFDSNRIPLKAFKRLPHIFRCDFESKLLPNVDVLRQAGVQYSEILNLLQYQPRAFMVDTDRFRMVVEEVKRMGFKPLGFKFVIAVHALRSMTKATWESKLRTYMRWGWSEEDCRSAFLKQPYIMVKSEEHIMKTMDLLVNEMGFDASLVWKAPYVLSYSFDRRLRPRCMVYKVLWEKGLKKRGKCLPSFSHPESDFLKNFVMRFEEMVPELLELYQKELGVSKKG